MKSVTSTCTYLDLAWAVTQGSSLAGSEHGDHFIQASLQRTKHLSPSLLLPAVSRNSHVQRPRPVEQMMCHIRSKSPSPVPLAHMFFKELWK